MNSLTLSGFIYNTELRYAANGNAYVKGSILITTGKDKEGNWETDFFPFVAFGELAEKISNEWSATEMDYRPSQPTTLRGKLSSREYTTNEGAKRHYIEMVAYEEVNAKEIEELTGTRPSSVNTKAREQVRQPQAQPRIVHKAPAVNYKNSALSDNSPF
jgi:single-stranded DNA-binding protein